MNSARKMEKVAKACVFKTNWGYFGLAGTDSHIWITELPGRDADEVKVHLLDRFERARRARGRYTSAGEIVWDSSYLAGLQQRVRAYFEGERVEFDLEVPVDISEGGSFSNAVFKACRGIGYGQTVSYGDLADLAGRKNASRAVGRVMAGNRMPLLVPCHRVLRKDGGLGGFSGPGGVVMKRRLLEHEERYGR